MDTTHQSPGAGIGFILLAMGAISFNDMLIKQLSGGYPLHQMVFIRSMIGISFSVLILHYEGGWALLRTSTPYQHALRGMFIVCANLCYFTALAAVPLAQATALFFVAPLLITLLSIPLLKEQVGPYRLGAVIAGFAGIILMVQPWKSADERDVAFVILILPVIGALFYALNQIMTRKLGGKSRASAMAIYIQATFLIVSTLFFIIAGDGRFAKGVENESVQFLLRAWVWPQGNDRYWFFALGISSAVIGYALSQAYRLADAATIAPFEYAGLPLAIFWGWMIWGELPTPFVWAGIFLIVGSGLFVFLREHIKKRRLNTGNRVPYRQ